MVPFVAASMLLSQQCCTGCMCSQAVVHACMSQALPHTVSANCISEHLLTVLALSACAGFIQSMEGQFKQDPADDSMPWPVKFVRTADPSVFSATIGHSRCPAVYKASEGLTLQARVSGVNMTSVSKLTLLISLLAALLLAHLMP